MDRETFFVTTAIVFIILSLITILFALTILVVIVYYWKSQLRSTTNLLTCNSCVALLYYSIATIIQIPMLLASDPPSTTRCKTQAFFYFNAATTMAYSYLIQAISRYSITILYKYKILLTFRVTWMLILTSWIASTILSGSMFISPLAYQYESESRFCLMTSKEFVSALPGMSISYCIPLTVILLLYTIILHHTTQNQSNSNTFTAIRLRRNLKVFRNILLFTLTLSTGGGPYIISFLINIKNEPPWPLYSFAILFISLSAMLNSLALFYTSAPVKTRLYAMIHRQQQPEAHQMTVRPARLIQSANRINAIQMLPGLC